MTTQACESPVSENIITFKIVSDSERMNFMPKHFGRTLIVAENLIYTYMDKLCEDYSGGMWKFYELSNGGVFLAPDHDEKMHLEWDGNWFSGDLSAEAAGIVATLFALNHLANHFNSDKFIDMYHQLRDYALNFHPEASLIYQAID